MAKKRNAAKFSRYHAPKYRASGGRQLDAWEPTAKEIAERAQEIQETWSDYERAKRVVMPPQPANMTVEFEHWYRRGRDITGTV